MGRDFGFMTRFWISTTELFVIMNSFMIIERNKNQWIYQWICDIQIIWKLSCVVLIRIIVFELLEHWTMLIVFLFLVLILSICLTIKPYNFILEFPKNMTKPPSLQKGSYKISPVHLSICLFVCLWHIFLRIYSVDFLIFLHEDIMPDILKSDKARFWKIAFVV